MSLHDEIEVNVNQGRLVRVEQLFVICPGLRVIYFTPKLKELLDGPWSDHKWEEHWNKVRQQIDEFIDGLPTERRITVRSSARKKSTCFMSLLDPEANEIWEIRCRDPKPGMRLFGSFVKKDVFVALIAAPHEFLSSEEDWNRTIQQYKEKWAKHFSATAFRGSYPHDYLTDDVILS